MRLRLPMLVSALLACTPAVAPAQDFGVLESAETINKGNFKIRGNPMSLFGKDADATTGIALAAGYGFTPRFDAEGNLAIYDGVTIFGGSSQFIVTWLIKTTGSPMAPAYYVMFGVALGLVAAFYMRDRAHEKLEH